MKTMLRHRVIKLAVIVNTMLFSLGIAGCAPESSRKSSTDLTKPLYEVGTPIALAFPGGNTAKVTIKAARYTTSSLGKHALPSSPRRGRFLVLDVVWESGKERTYASFARISALDITGKKSGRVLRADDAFPAGEVMPGERVRGVVAFDVASDGPVDILFHDAYTKEVSRITMPPI
jgi:hypothetical protein